MAKHINELYEDILKAIKEIKANIMLELANEISFYGELPPDVVRELNVLGNIEGRVIYMLKERGIEIKEKEDKPGYLYIEMNGETYITHKSKLLIDDAKTETNNEENKKGSESEETQEICEESITEEPEFIPLDISDENNDEIFDEEHETDIEEYSEEVDEMDNETEADADVVETEHLEKPKATIIGGDYNPDPVITPMNRTDVFIEEKRKHKNNFVFDSYKLSVCHKHSHTEEMQFMIAPLKMQKNACPSVPIIVSVYYKGKLYTASSFDKNEDGANIVFIDVNEYYFICRGFFNDAGEFQSTIATTGISISQEDQVNVLSHKKHNPTDSSVGNGHLKFHYEGEDGPGIVEVFPLELDDNDFIIMTRCGEFVEYIPITGHSYGLNRAILYDAGIKSELVCVWDGDYLEADIMPI